MNILNESSFITEQKCGSNFSYILSDNNIFSTTEYKVLQNQTNNCFVKCMKMLYNGRIQIYYLTESLRTFETMIPALDVEGFLTICANLISDVIDVKSNGFLSCQNIDLTFNHIYVDPTNYKVSLIYLPIAQKLFDSMSSFENELRTHLIKVIQNSDSVSSPKLQQFADNLANGSMTLENLYTTIKTGKINDSVDPSPKPVKVMMKLVALNAPSRLEIVIDKDQFAIGRKSELVDGVVSLSRMIGRRHCLICRNGDQFTVTDLQSANGCCINRMRIQSGQPHPLKNKDILRLADIDFQVVIV